MMLTTANLYGACILPEVLGSVFETFISFKPTTVPRGRCSDHHHIQMRKPRPRKAR